MTYPNPSVPVVGITPSQMVANVFCTATGSSGTSSAMGTTVGASKVGALGSVGQHHSYPGAPGVVSHSAGFPSAAFSCTPPLSSTLNGLPPHSSASMGLQNGTCSGTGSGGGGSWPPEGSHLTAATTADLQDDDRFEAKWAALETKPGAQEPGSKTPPSTANPFSNNLQKTFEIEL